MLSRMPIVRTGEEGERLATIGHLDDRAARLLRALLHSRRTLFYHKSRGALRECLVEKAVPIGMHPAQRHKQCLWHNVTGIRRQMAHRTMCETRQDASLEAIEEVHQLTGRLQHKTPPMLSTVLRHAAPPAKLAGQLLCAALRAVVPCQFSILSIRPHGLAHVPLIALPLLRRSALARGPPAAVLQEV